MQNAVAFANSDVTTVAWSFGQKLERCMGFAVYCVDADGKETALPAVAVFPGFKRATGDTCKKFPIQEKYFNADGSIRVVQLRFWLSALA